MLPIASTGQIDADAAAEILAARAAEIAVVSVQWANNETGVIHPIERLLSTKGSRATPSASDG